MLKRLGAVLAVVAAGSVAGCNTSTDTPYLVTGGPNPAPQAGYKVDCTSTPGIFYPAFHDFSTSCRQIVPPVRSQTVIRARG
jgi:hypothetical protein